MKATNKGSILIAFIFFIIIGTTLEARVNGDAWFENYRTQEISVSRSKYTPLKFKTPETLVIPFSLADTILYENFEAGVMPSGWILENGGGNSIIWDIGTGATYPPPDCGTSYARIIYPITGPPVAADTDYIVAPAKKINSEADGLFLQFGWGMDWYDTEQLITNVRFHNGSSWGTWFWGAESADGSGTKAIDLSPYLPADSVQVRWGFYSDGGENGQNGAIDNVVMWTGSCGIYGGDPIPPIAPVIYHASLDPFLYMGLMVSPDGGEMWYPTFLFGNELVNIEPDPFNYGWVYVSGSGQFAVYRSKDFGFTWHDTLQIYPPIHSVFDVDVDPCNGDLYLGTECILGPSSPWPDTNYVWWSNDNGENWIPIGEGIPFSGGFYGEGVYSLTQGFEQPSSVRLYAGTSDGSGSGGVSGTSFGVYTRLAGAGSERWEYCGLSGAGGIAELICEPEHPEICFAGASPGGSDPLGAIYKTTDTGATWERIFDPATVPGSMIWGDFDYYPDGNGTGFLCAPLDWALGVAVSTDGGDTWNIYSGFSDGVEAIDIYPAEPDIICAGTQTYSGLPVCHAYMSTDAGNTWSPKYYTKIRWTYTIEVDPEPFIPDISTNPASLVFDYFPEGYKGLSCPSQTRAPGIPVITNDLKEQMGKTTREDLIPIIIIMTEQINSDVLYREASKLCKKEKREWVSSQLKSLANRSQELILSYLRSKGIKNLNSLWIVNAISVEVNKDAITELSSMSGIQRILYNDKCLRAYGAVSKRQLIPLERDITWGVQKVEADKVWVDLGYTGAGIIVGHTDTGVNYNHTDLADHMWDGGVSYPHHGWDFVNNDDDPIDDNGHGTHTAGTVAGDGTSGTQTGVAPDALIMALKVLNASGSGDISDLADAVQFAIDNGADVISISLGVNAADKYIKDFMRYMCNNAFASDLPMAIAAGNGAGGGSHYKPPYDIGSPADVPASWYGSGGHSASIAVGATDAYDYIGGFSSRGPTMWFTDTYQDYTWPPGLIKPDVSAPGVNIISLSHSSNTGYTSGWSGTSSAAPHVAGTIALMLEKNPALTSVEIDSILECTSTDLGYAGKDNYYGAGRINAYNAVFCAPPVQGDKQVFHICNLNATGYLHVSAITWSCSWIKAVNPVSFWTPTGESTGVEVYVDTTGLSPGTYFDTLWISSNDYDATPYPEPVTLIFEEHGIEEMEKSTQSPLTNALYHISPNPFRQMTEIKIQMQDVRNNLSTSLGTGTQDILLKIYDVSGRIVKVFNLASGILLPASAVSWDGTDKLNRKVPAGVYFVRLEIGDTNKVEKVILLR